MDARYALIALALLLLSACGDDPPAAAAAPQENSAPTRAGGSDCSGMSRTHCMEAPGCTLELRPGKQGKAGGGPGYVCRAAVGPCETGVNQARLSGSNGEQGSQHAITECNGMGKCTARAGECFCACHGHGETKVPDGQEAPTCQCRCSGGPPPVCSPY